MAGNGGVSSLYDLQFEFIDLGLAYTRGYDLAANPGVVSRIQLFNPAASSKVVQVLNVFMAAFPAGAVEFYRSNGAITNLYDVGLNLRTSVVDGIAEIRFNYGGAPPGLLTFVTSSLSSGTLQVFDHWGPRLNAGDGFTFVTQVVNTRLIVRFDWIEMDA